jgi:hypothetical protein
VGPHTQSCRRLDTGPLGEGSRFENIQRVGPFRFRYLYTVQSYEPGRAVSLVAESSTFVATDTLTFRSSEEQRRHGWTEVTYTARFELKGPARLGAPLFRLLLGRIADEGRAGLTTTLARLATEGRTPSVSGGGAAQPAPQGGLEGLPVAGRES